jgi:hypothetical protein
MAKEFNISAEGIADVLKMFDNVSANEAVRDIEKITETYARKMASEAADMAPVKTGRLKNSLAASPRKADDEELTWVWGSDLPYATRQEYEHKTKKAFVRKAIWSNENDYVDAVKRRITKG